MSTFLLNWNPARWTWTSLAETVERVQGGEPAQDRWSFGQRTSGAGAGDRFFMLRQGREPRGIFGSGVIRSEPYQGEHWEGEGLGNYVDIEFETLANPDAEPQLVLPLAELAERFPEFNFQSVRGSGWELPADIARRIEPLWLARYGRAAHLVRLPEEAGRSEVLVEGAVRTVTVNAYERSFAARRACIAHWGTRCCVCGFDFAAVYGELGAGYILAHHLVPLSEIRTEYVVDPVNDLRPICPNCHAMVHRREPPLSIDELRQVLRRGGE